MQINVTHVVLKCPTDVIVFFTAVGGLISSVQGPYTDPLYVPNKPPDDLHPVYSSGEFEDEEEHKKSADKIITDLRTKNKIPEKDLETSLNEPKRESWNTPQMLIPEPNFKRNKITTVPELELRKLERGEFLISDMVLVMCLIPCLISAPAPLLSCFQTST